MLIGDGSSGRIAEGSRNGEGISGDDCANPAALGDFWSEVLGYREAPPPAGFDNWQEALLAQGVPEEKLEAAYAIVDPDGVGPRMFFQRVPEGKVAKNRVHLDIRVAAAHGVAGGDREAVQPVLDAEADRLVGLGASVMRTVDEDGEYFMVLQDPECNEFCLT
jgi:hypothetical protein